MNITAKVNKIKEPKGNTQAFASITLDDSFVVGGLAVVKGEKGLFVSMPSKKNEKDGKYYDTCYPLSKELRQEISNVVLEVYNDDELPF